MSMTATEAMKLSNKAEYKINGYTYSDKLKAQDKAIMRACEAGRRRTTFSIHDTIYDEWEREMKQHYTNLGYWFEPTGYIGGVWQKTEDICW